MKCWCHNLRISIEQTLRENVFFRCFSYTWQKTYKYTHVASFENTHAYIYIYMCVCCCMRVRPCIYFCGSLLSIYLSIYLFISLSIYLSICLPISIIPSVYLSLPPSLSHLICIQQLSNIYQYKHASTPWAWEAYIVLQRRQSWGRAESRSSTRIAAIAA